MRDLPEGFLRSLLCPTISVDACRGRRQGGSSDGGGIAGHWRVSVPEREGRCPPCRPLALVSLMKPSRDEIIGRNLAADATPAASRPSSNFNFLFLLERSAGRHIAHDYHFALPSSLNIGCFVLFL
ncbi:unnamed protein product [Victoria cruziana]